MNDRPVGGTGVRVVLANLNDGMLYAGARPPAQAGATRSQVVFVLNAWDVPDTDYEGLRDRSQAWFEALFP